MNSGASAGWRSGGGVGVYLLRAVRSLIIVFEVDEVVTEGNVVRCKRTTYLLICEVLSFDELYYREYYEKQSTQ